MKKSKISIISIFIIFLFANNSTFAQSNNGEQMAMLKIGDRFSKKEIKRDASEKKYSKNYNIGLRERYELLTALKKIFPKEKSKISVNQQKSKNLILKTETKMDNGKKVVVITRGITKKKNSNNKLFTSLKEALND